MTWIEAIHRVEDMTPGYNITLGLAVRSLFLELMDNGFDPPIRVRLDQEGHVCLDWPNACYTVTEAGGVSYKRQVQA